MTGGWPACPAAAVGVEDLPPQPTFPRVKVLHVITRFWAGAGGNTLLSALGMSRDRYDVWITGCAGGPLWAPAAAGGVTVVPLTRLRESISPLNDLIVVWQLVRLIRRERFTIVHTHSAKGGFLGRIAAWLCRTPVVLHTFHGFSFHDYMSRRRRTGYLLLERLVRPMTDAFLAVAPLVAREAVERRLAPPGKVTVVPSAIDMGGVPEARDGRLRKELGLGDEVRLVGTVGRIDFQKAPLDFVRMAAAVQRLRQGVAFVMVGDGPLEDAVREEAERLGVPINLTGFRADASRLASSFDVFVISSLYEGLGRALTEALASGRPVVATAVNGVPDLIAPGRTGLLAPPADPEVLAANVVWMLDHPEAARRMGQNGRARVLGSFDQATMCGLLDEVYSGLLGMVSPAAGDAAAIGVRRTA